MRKRQKVVGCDMGSSVLERSVSPLVGVDILGLITSGMYTDPLAVYREYIQNAVDSIHDAGIAEPGRIEISIGREDRRVTVRDNGPGLSLSEARLALIPIAKSKKKCEQHRGFRGIGRLVGLAFGESVTFLTRSGAETPVVRVSWDGGQLRQGIKAGDSLESVLESSVKVEAVVGDGYPARFFEVSIDGVSRYAASSIMNRDVVRRYVGEVCPVPFAANFSYASEISGLFGDGCELRTVDIYLDEDKDSIERPHGRSVNVSERENDEVVGIEEIRITGLGTRTWSAVGWIARTSYRGAIPKNRGVRCLRARVGNMQIGGEDIFDHLFSEDRFNRWCIGEIHILDPAIVPNARRDYFEPGPHLRNLENQLGVVCRHLEQRCRSASKERRGQRRAREFVEHAEEALELASTGYLSAEKAQKLIADKIAEISKWKEKHLASSSSHEAVAGLKKVEDGLNSFQAKPGWEKFTGVGATEMVAYQEVFGVLAEVLTHPAVAKRTIETILERMGVPRR